MTRSIPILMYHAVDEKPTAETRRLSVTPRALEEQVSLLVDLGFTGMSFSELGGALEAGAALPERPVVLTFDDGYADFADNAWPLLQRYDFPATVFVTSGWTADAGPDAAGTPLGPMLSRSQLRDLAASGCEIGAHSHSHPELDQLGDEALRAELLVGRTLLEDCIGTSVLSLAYPFGYSTPRVRRATRDAGYRCAAAVRNVRASSSDDLFALPRLTIRRKTDVATFLSIMTGGDKPIFRRDRLLTAGWAAVRGSRRAGKRVLGNV